jgi:hypothetical protein
MDVSRRLNPVSGGLSAKWRSDHADGSSRLVWNSKKYLANIASVSITSVKPAALAASPTRRSPAPTSRRRSLGPRAEHRPGTAGQGLLHVVGRHKLQARVSRSWRCRLNSRRSAPDGGSTRSSPCRVARRASDLPESSRSSAARAFPSDFPAPAPKADGRVRHRPWYPAITLRGADPRVPFHRIEQITKHKVICLDLFLFPPAGNQPGAFVKSGVDQMRKPGKFAASCSHAAVAVRSNCKKRAP